MCTQMRNLLIVLTICDFFVGSAYAGESLQTRIEQLRMIDHVTGSAVYAGGGPGAFFTLSKAFMQKETEEDFLKLVSDDNPVVRSMGLLCLAQRKQSVGMLKEHLTDKDLIYYCPGGCSVSRITVGNFVRTLLNNANHLDYWAPSLPVLSKEELIALDIEILAKDSTTSFHGEAAKALSNFLEERGTVPALRGLQPYQLIKAIGRLGASPGQRKFLIACLWNKDFDATSTLAAASALTRDSNETALSAIESERTRLNGITQGDWGDRFLETLQNRISHEKLIRAIRDKYGRQGIEIVDDTVIGAFSNSHPLAFPDLTDDAFFRQGPHYNKLCDIAGNSIVEMSKHLEKFDQLWNTYSDTAYALSFVITMRKGHLTFNRIFSPARRSEIEKNVQEAMANHFESKSSRWNDR